MNSKDVQQYTNNLALVARDLMSKGLSMDEAIEKAPIEYEIRQRQFSRMLEDDSFKTAYIGQLKKHINN